MPMPSSTPHASPNPTEQVERLLPGRPNKFGVLLQGQLRHHFPSQGGAFQDAILSGIIIGSRRLGRQHFGHLYHLRRGAFDQQLGEAR